MDARLALASIAGIRGSGHDQDNETVVHEPSYGQINYYSPVLLALARFYRIEPSEILVVHDELDIPPGQLRLKFGGGLGEPLLLPALGLRRAVGPPARQLDQAANAGLPVPAGAVLLDEFYRTGIVLAGRLPAWWLVPPAAEAHYAQFCRQLTKKRYVKSAELVDFGGISSIPQGEFVGAGIWQLYKAIDSPFKSVLKLLLFEVYAAQFPRTESLSTDYKRAVHQGVVGSIRSRSGTAGAQAE